MDRTQGIDQHHLTVDAGKMIAKERFDHLRLIRLVPAVHLAQQRPARGVARGQRCKGQNRRARQITGQQEPARCAVGIARPPRVLQIGGKAGGQILGQRFVQLGGPVHLRHLAAVVGGLFAAGDGFQRGSGPFGIGLVHQRQIQQPRYIAVRALSPDVAMVSHASSGTPILAIWVVTLARGRGALVTRTTVPPVLR